MNTPHEKFVLKEVKNNYMIAYSLLKDNWQAFAKTEIFSFVAVFIIILLMRIITGLLFILQVHVTGSPIPGSPFPEGPFPRGPRGFNLAVYFNLVVIVNIFFLTFLTSQFGLANDIFNSGHMYAEFSSSFSYFKKHWFIYFILTIAIYWSSFLGDPLSTLPIAAFYERTRVIPIDFTSINEFFIEINLLLTFLRQILLGIIQLITIILVVGILPAVTRTNKFKLAIKENFSILRRNKKLVILTWFIYFLIFILMQVIVNVVLLFVIRTYFDNSVLYLIGIFHLFINISFLFISIPFMALLSTRMYVSLKTNPN